MRGQHVGRAPDYTNAALTMGLVNLLWIFVALWVAFGLPWVLIVGWALNRGITAIARARGSAD